MDEARYERIGAATGLAAVVLFVLGFLVTPTAPGVDADAQEVFTYFVEDQDPIRLGVLLLALGIGALVWFLGTLRTALANAELGSERLASIAFGAGVVSIAALTFELGTLATAAFRPEQTTPELTRAIWDLGTMVAGVASVSFAVFFAAIAVATLRTAALPRQLGWLAAVTALATVLGVGRLFTDSGLLADDGLLGSIAGFVLFLAWTAAASATLMGRFSAPRPRRRRAES